ncbi:MAG: metallophosphoesterase [Pleurocapsa minor GSE-CHR-MK-17-07R]|jgi:Icc protein|nr:metallophosphoesterase [Pleurocapsa minor GSE-CHR-MK 17-07R]
MSDTHFHLNPDYTEPFSVYGPRLSTEKLIETINALPMPIDFVLHTGDVVHLPETGESYTGARALLDTIRHPVLYVPGNHDNVAMFQHNFMGVPLDQITPTYDRVLTINNVQVVLLDSHAPADSSDAYGYLTDAQLEWMDGICSMPDARPLVVALHHHTLPLEAPWLDTMVLLNGDALHNILLKARSRIRGVFYGHIHESVATVRDGIAYYSAQSTWFQTRTWYGAEQPVSDPLINPGFNLVTLTERDTFVRFVRIPL